jgi:hypothetical protein
MSLNGPRPLRCTYIPVIGSYSFRPPTIYDFRKMVSEYNMTHMIIARQRLGKYSLRVTLSKVEGHLLLGRNPKENIFLRIRVYCSLASNRCPSFSRIVVRMAQQRPINQKSVSSLTCLSNRCLAVDRYVTILCKYL